MSDELMYTQEEVDDVKTEAYDEGFEEGVERGRELGREEVVDDPLDYLSHSDIDGANESYVNDSPMEWVTDSVIANFGSLATDELVLIGKAVVEYLEELNE